MEDITEIIKVFKCLEFETYEWNIYYDGKLQINCDTMTTYLDKLLNYIEQLEKENFELKQREIIHKLEVKPKDNFYEYYDFIPKSVIREELRTLKNMLPTALHETSRAVFNGEIALLERILGEE